MYLTSHWWKFTTFPIKLLFSISQSCCGGCGYFARPIQSVNLYISMYWGFFLVSNVVKNLLRKFVVLDFRAPGNILIVFLLLVSLSCDWYWYILASGFLASFILDQLFGPATSNKSQTPTRPWNRDKTNCRCTGYVLTIVIENSMCCVGYDTE